MRIIGAILILAGILMLVFNNIDLTTKEKVAEIGPIEINKKENKSIDWPSWTGGIAIVAGIVVLATARKQIK